MLCISCSKAVSNPDQIPPHNPLCPEAAAIFVDPASGIVKMHYQGSLCGRASAAPMHVKGVLAQVGLLCKLMGSGQLTLQLQS